MQPNFMHPRSNQVVDQEIGSDTFFMIGLSGFDGLRASPNFTSLSAGTQTHTDQQRSFICVILHSLFASIFNTNSLIHDMLSPG